MSASEAMVMNPNNVTTTESTAKLTVQNDVEFAKCDCCGLTEECTPAYIDRIRQRFQGKWICGLCAEAVNYEMRLVSTEEALIQHMSFCNQFKSSVPPPNPTVHLISAMRRILRRSLDSPRSLRSMPSSPTKREGLSRSESCIPALSLVGQDESYPTSNQKHTSCE